MQLNQKLIKLRNSENFIVENLVSKRLSRPHAYLSWEWGREFGGACESFFNLTQKPISEINLAPNGENLPQAKIVTSIWDELLIQILN